MQSRPTRCPARSGGGRQRADEQLLDHGEVGNPCRLVVHAHLLDTHTDAARFRRTEKGVCLITRDMLDRLA